MPTVYLYKPKFKTVNFLFFPFSVAVTKMGPVPHKFKIDYAEGLQYTNLRYSVIVQTAKLPDGCIEMYECNSPRAFKPGFMPEQKGYILFFVLAGALTIQRKSTGQTVALGARHCILSGVFPEEYSMEVPKGKCIVLAVTLNSGWFHRICRGLPYVPDKGEMPAFSISFGMWRIISFLLGYVAENTDDPASLLEDKVAALLYEYERLLDQKMEHDRLRIARVTEHIRWCIRRHEPVPAVSLLVSEFGFSQRNLEYLFKGLTGKTPVQYITDMRMQEALRLLKESELPIVDIAELLGYNSFAYFSAAFKKHFGYPPSAARTGWI